MFSDRLLTGWIKGALVESRTLIRLYNRLKVGAGRR